MAKTLRQRRVDAGQCPQCGKEAAPYYLCPRCRRIRSLGSKLKQGEKHGVFKNVGNQNLGLWIAGPNKIEDVNMDARVSPLWGEGGGADDKRLRPKLGKIPVDVERELVGMLTRFDRPVTEAEIVAAWGKLRVRRGRASAAGDLVALIAAERRRERRNRKRRLDSHD